MLLARLRDGRQVLALPGNPLAALIALLMVGWPLLQARSGRPSPALMPLPVPPGQTSGSRPRAVCCTLEDGVLVPVAHQRPMMPRGISAATHLAVLGGAQAQVLPLP